jgi:hypothetical protein
VRRNHRLSGEPAFVTRLVTLAEAQPFHFKYGGLLKVR